MSVTTMVVLVGTSAGCVTWKHHVNRHGIGAIVAKHQDQRYYHCSHCGQIVPREGFSKCPRCMQVPVYHGYEPTCWRQWPEGWGCPPESVVNNPEFWVEGMVESDHEAMSSEAPIGQPEESSESEVQFGSDAEEVVPPAPDQGEVSLPKPTEDIAAVEPNPATEDASIPTAQLTQSVAEVPSVPEIASDSTNVASTSDESPEPITVVKAAKEKSRDVVVRSTNVVADVAQTPQTTSTKEHLATSEEKVEVASESLLVVESDQADVRQEIEPETAFVAEPVSTSVLDLEYEPSNFGEQSRRNEQLTAQAEPIVEPQPEPLVEPQQDRLIVNRVPIPTTRTNLETSARQQTQSVVQQQVPELDEPAEASSILRQSPSVIDVSTESKSVVSEQKVDAVIQPHDEQGPIPVRRVRLTGAESRPLPATAKPTSSEPVVKTAEGNSVLAPNVDDAALEARPAPAKRLAVPQDRNGLHPQPVRRIQLSELPVRLDH